VEGKLSGSRAQGNVAMMARRHNDDDDDDDDDDDG